MKREQFIEQENWYGSHYELAMEYAPQGDDDRLLKAIAGLWDASELQGPWWKVEDHGTSPSLPHELDDDVSYRQYGVFQLPDGQSIGCLSVIVRETAGPDATDWLDLCIPMGMLELAFDIHYPISLKDNPWTNDIDRVLVGVAERVYEASPFDVAAIGEEVSGRVRGRSLTAATLAQGGVLLPRITAQTSFPQVDAVTLQSGLRWYPWHE